MNTTLPRRYATVSEGAAYARVNSKTIRRLISSGQLAGYHLGSRLIRIDLDELDQLMVRIPTVGQDD
jgi:excisionase family DNA binding protein